MVSVFVPYYIIPFSGVLKRANLCLSALLRLGGKTPQLSLFASCLSGYRLYSDCLQPPCLCLYDIFCPMKELLHLGLCHGKFLQIVRSQGFLPLRNLSNLLLTYIFNIFYFSCLSASHRFATLSSPPYPQVQTWTPSTQGSIQMYSTRFSRRFVEPMLHCEHSRPRHLLKVSRTRSPCSHNPCRKMEWVLERPSSS